MPTDVDEVDPLRTKDPRQGNRLIGKGSWNSGFFAFNTLSIPVLLTYPPDSSCMLSLRLGLYALESISKLLLAAFAW
jgi:hypothetical protein